MTFRFVANLAIIQVLLPKHMSEHDPTLCVCGGGGGGGGRGGCVWVWVCVCVDILPP